jgi:hypothetical protein
MSAFPLCISNYSSGATSFVCLELLFVCVDMFSFIKLVSDIALNLIIYFNCACTKLIPTHKGPNRPGATIPSSCERGVIHTSYPTPVRQCKCRSMVASMGMMRFLLHLSTVSLTLPIISVPCNVVARYLSAFPDALIEIHVSCVAVLRVCF